ncbi:MAG TPA: DUF1648 domain-containing protein [Clostridia bacterium]|nr:DUF1648 domain-containing protein [Clostridia bacterium]
MKVINRILYISMAIPLISAIVAMFILPSTIPVHSNASGIIDRYGSKFELFILPAFTILFGLFMRLIIKFAFRLEELRVSLKNIIGVICIIAVLIFCYIEISWIITALMI